jgi:uncharacterized protein (DUF433 family)
MRIRVSDVLDLLAQGQSFEQVLEDFPDLTDADIRACIAYASKRVSHSTIKVA